MKTIARGFVLFFVALSLAGCGDGAVTAPTATTLEGSTWSGPFSESGLGSGTLTLTFAAAGSSSASSFSRWSLATPAGTILGGLRVVPRTATDPPDAVTLGLATAVLDPNCDMMFAARISGTEMRGTMRSGICDAGGARVAEVTLNRR